MWMRAVARASLIFWISSRVFGQPAPPMRSFEVASVRPHSGPIISVDVTTSGPRLTAPAQNVELLIMYAYGLKNYQISYNALSRFADVRNDTRYDIVAKAEGDEAPTKDEFREMMQSLLADRFQLKVHREMQETPVYALVLSKNGPKFKGSASDAVPMGHFHQETRNMVVTLTKATMDDVVHAITTAGLGRPLLDKTGLTGTYDITLTYTPERISRSSADPGDLSVFTAVQSQLGLKLEAQRAMLEILIVDHIEKPATN
jgi:uncharacterized protein (TIGR03435 family)